jgi:hypothetical protein
MIKYNILDFLREHHMDIWKEFHRYKRKDNPPAIGSKVRTLVSGYGSFGGTILEVVEYNDKHIRLQSSTGESYLCKLENWWKDLDILEEPYIEPEEKE